MSLRTLARVALATTLAAALAVAVPHATLGAQAKGGRKAAPRPKPDSVRLRFGWTTGTTAIVESRMMRHRDSDGKRDSAGIGVRYRLSVHPHAEGILVRTDSFSVPGMEKSAATDTAAMLQRLVEQVGFASAAYVVNREGEFRRLDDAAAAKARLDSAMAPMLKEIKDAPPQLRAMMEQLTSPEALSATAEREWNVLVGTWSGAEWEIGELYVAEVEEPVPVMPGLMMPMVYQFSATGRVACDGSERGPRDCVELHMVAVPDSAGMHKLVTEITSRLAPEAAREMSRMLGSMRTETEVIVVAEPATLRPHFLSQVQQVEVRAAATTGDEPTVATQRRSRLTRYRYEGAARPR